MSDPTFTRARSIPEQRPERRLAGWLVSAVLIAASLFALRPGLDLAVTAWFHHPGIGFPAEQDPRLMFLRATLWGSSQAMFGLALAGLLANALRRRAIMGVPSRIWGFVLCLYALGPGVMVELVTKPLWGRARPADTTAFGGEHPFSPPLELVDYCSRNCSFVSGEVSGTTVLAISLIVLALVLRPRLPALVVRVVIIVAPLAPIISALQRISAGRHFLSDCVFSILLTALLALGLAVALRLNPHWGAGGHRTGT